MCASGNNINLYVPHFNETGFVNSWELEWQYKVSNDTAISAIIWAFNDTEDRFYYATNTKICLVIINGNNVFIILL